MKIPYIELDEADRRNWDNLRSNSVGSHHVRIDNEGWLQRQARNAIQMPSVLYSAVRDFRRDSQTVGALLIDGISTDSLQLTQTPANYGAYREIASPEAVALVAVGSVLGEPVGYSEEKSGSMVHDIVPIRGFESTQSNAGSAQFALHIENAFHDHRPDFVLLLCVREDHEKEAGLCLAPIREALQLLSASVINTLFEPRFRTAAPASFSAQHETRAHSVLSGARGDPDIRADMSVTVGVDTVANDALAELWSALASVVSITNLKAGQMVIVDNRVTLHGRTEFIPRFDGADRWLLRLFVKSDLRQSRALRSDDGRQICSV